MSLVSYSRVHDSSDESMKRAVRNSLDLIDFRFAEDVRNVAIKANMCYYWDYSTGLTTDPRFVAALIEVIREQTSPDVNISVVESDASAMKCKEAFRILGYEKMAQRSEVSLVNLSEDEYERVTVEVGGQSFHFKLPLTIRDAELRVNVPKIKYLDGTKITCALKNIFGCNPYPNKFRYHPRLDETIVALNKAMKFNLCVVDGIIVSGVQPLRLGLVMSGQDPVAVDIAAAEIAGVNGRSVRHIRLAEREKVGNASFIPRGVRSEYFERRYPKKKAENKVMDIAFKMVQVMGLEGRLGL